MIRFNATVTTVFPNRDGDFVLNIKPDRGDVIQVKHWEALPEGKRVLLVAGKIEGVQ